MKLKRLLKLFVILLLFDLMAFVSMVAVYSLPTTEIVGNVQKSIDIYNQEGDYPKLVYKHISTYFDNFTDAIMLNKAMHKRADNLHDIMQDALLNPEYKITNVSSKTTTLISSIYSLNKVTVITDPRYWHGYLIFLKPLLYFFNMYDIRMLNLFLQFVLLIFVILQLYEKGGYRLALPFSLVPIIFNLISCAFCIQFATMYYTLMISCLVMLKRNMYLSDKYVELFFVIGMCTSFFNTLTYPLVTLGIPLILLIILNDEKLCSKIIKMAIASTSWLIGCVGNWVSKWIITYLLTDHDIFSEGWQAFTTRMSHSNLRNNTIRRALRNNLSVYDNNLTYVLITISLIILIYVCIRKKYYLKLNSSIIIPLLFMVIGPFLWAIIVRNHSIEHWWMTYRMFSISFLAVAYMISYSLEKRKRQGRFNKGKNIIKNILSYLNNKIKSKIHFYKKS